MTADADAIPLLVTLGHTGDSTFNLRFPLEYRDEILSLLDDNQIEHGTVLELSAATELAIEAVKVLGAGGGLAALASFYKTFAHRHDGKRVVLKDGDEVSGLSLKQTELFLQKRAIEQADADGKWRQAIAEMRQDETN